MHLREALGLTKAYEYCHIPTYLKILKVASKERLNIDQMSCRIEYSPANTGLKIQTLERKGLLKKEVSGVNRFIVLTEKGKKLIEGVRE